MVPKHHRFARFPSGKASPKMSPFRSPPVKRYAQWTIRSLVSAISCQVKSLSNSPSGQPSQDVTSEESTLSAKAGFKLPVEAPPECPGTVGTGECSQVFAAKQGKGGPTV